MAKRAFIVLFALNISLTLVATRAKAQPASREFCWAADSGRETTVHDF